MSIKSVMPSSHLTFCCFLLLLLPMPPSIRVFSNESTLHMRWPSIGVSALASVLPMGTQDLPPLGWTGWISLQSKGLWRVFSNTTVQKHQFFGAQPSSQSSEYSGLISFRIDWFDFAIQESSPTPQFKASIFQHPGFFMVLHSHLWMTIEKTIALTRRIFLGKVMPLLFNTLSRLIIASLPMS